MPIAPCPAAGRNLSSGSNSLAWASRPKRFRPGESEQGAVDLAALDFFQSGLDIAAQQHGLYVGAQTLDLRRAAQRRRADDGALGKLRQRRAAAPDKCVARVLARQIAGDEDIGGQMRRQILRRVHGEVDGAGDQRRVQFLGEQALAPGFGEGAILNRVPGRADHLD